MHNVVMNNDNFIATHPRTVSEYTLKCETTTKIFSACKLNSLIYALYVLFFGLCVLLIFYSYLKLFVISWNFFKIQFVSQNIHNQKQSYSKVLLYIHIMKCNKNNWLVEKCGQLQFH